MYVNEMIMVISNDKGIEKGALMIYPDYLQKVVFEHALDKEVIATMVEDIVTTRGNCTTWGEHYCASNKTTYAKYCKDQYELKCFLSGGYKEHENFELDIDACSKECLELLDALNITLDGKQRGSMFHYEKGNRIYEVEIRETLSSIQNIEAESMEDALYEAEQRYRNEAVVLDDSNHVETEYIPVGKRR